VSITQGKGDAASQSESDRRSGVRCAGAVFLRCPRRQTVGPAPRFLADNRLRPPSLRTAKSNGCSKRTLT